MTLLEIREVQTFTDLKPAIRQLCDSMHHMTWGEFMAYKRTIEHQCFKIGSNLKELNNYAEQYQVYGYE